MMLEERFGQLLAETDGLLIEAQVQARLLEYLALIHKWNKVHNLTAIREPEKMLTHHLMDSLAVMPFVKSGRMLDVGSGAGLPGIVVAIMRPDIQVTTIDSVQKKTTFMRQAKASLGLNNLDVVSGRVEQLQVEEKFNQIVSRAFSELGLFVRLTQHLLANDGVWLAMKGVYPTNEIQDLQKEFLHLDVHVDSLNVAGLEAERHLVTISMAKEK